MPQIIEIPNVGQVEFPDSMSDAQITSAIQNNILKSSTQPKQEPQEKRLIPTLPEFLEQGVNTAFPIIGPGIVEGVKDAGRGVKQAFLQGTEKLGLQPEGTTNQYTQETDAARQAFQQTPTAQLFPTATAYGQLMGNTVPAMAIGGGPVTGGALIGGLQYVPEGGSRALNTIMGAAAGKTGDLAFKTGAKVYNAVKGNFTNPAAKEIIDLGVKHDVPVFLPDAVENKFIKGVSEGLEEIPLLGMKGARAFQNQKTGMSAQNLKDEMQRRMMLSQFDNVPQLEQIAKGNSIRAPAAKKLLEEINASGDDWNKVLQVSGNNKLFQNKLLADEKFNKVAVIADNYGAVGNSNTIQSIDSAIKEINESVLPDKAMLSTLETLKSNIGAGNLNYSKTRKARAKIGSMIRDYYTGKNAAIGEDGVQYLQSIKNGIDGDLNTFAQKNGPELKNAWQDADRFYSAAVAPYKDAQLAKALKNASPDEIYSTFITSGDEAIGKGTGRASKLYNALDEKGQSAVRYGMTLSAFQKAYNAERGTFSPAKFASELDRVSSAKGVFFKGAAKAEIDGFKNLMRHVERSAVAINKPETGVKAIQWLVGFAAVPSAFLAPGTTAAAGGLTYAMKKLMTTRAGRNFLLASSKIQPGSPAMQKLIERTEKLLRTTAVVGATKPGEEE